MISATNIPASHGGGKTGLQENCNDQSVVSVLKFPSDRRPTQHSKKNNEQLYLINLVRGRCAAGQSVSEMDIQHLCGRFKGDSLKALKQVHRFYPRQTTLTIQNNIWVLEPIFTGSPTLDPEFNRILKQREMEERIRGSPLLTDGMEDETIAINIFGRDDL